MPAIDVVSDANVALKWFHAEGEEEVPEARALVAAHQARTVALQVLDLTAYEVGSALLRGRAKATAGQVATVLEALVEICPAARPDPDELRLAADLAARHDLTRRSIARCSRRGSAAARASSPRASSRVGSCLRSPSVRRLPSSGCVTACSSRCPRHCPADATS